MVARKDQTSTLPILNAVDMLMSTIRKHHPDVPHVAIVVGAKGAKRNSMTYGHFHAKQWTGAAEHEIMLSGEGLARGAEATLGTVLHEAAHAIAHARGVQDTSNNGRYHNKRFKAIAEELGIEVEITEPTRGWSATKLAEGTTERYAKPLEALSAALTTYKKSEVAPAGPDKPRRSTKVKIDCACGTPVSVSKIWFEEKLHGIECGDCFSKFKITEEN